MATGTLYFSAMDVVHDTRPLNNIWTNFTTILGQYNTVQSSTWDAYSAINQYRGGSIGDIISPVYGEPDALDSCLVRFWDLYSNHTVGIFTCDIYNPDTSAWEILETFNAGNILPDTNTEFDYTVAMKTKFAAATDKRAFLSDLKIRWYLSSAPGGVGYIATRGIKIEYTYYNWIIPPNYRRIVCLGDLSNHGGSIITTNADGNVYAGATDVAVHGALHLCPIPDHGTTPVSSIITKTKVNGKLVLTTNAIAGCGAKMNPPDRKVYVE